MNDGVILVSGVSCVIIGSMSNAYYLRMERSGVYYLLATGPLVADYWHMFGLCVYWASWSIAMDIIGCDTIVS